MKNINWLVLLTAIILFSSCAKRQHAQRYPDPFKTFRNAKYTGKVGVSNPQPSEKVHRTGARLSGSK